MPSRSLPSTAKTSSHRIQRDAASELLPTRYYSMAGADKVERLASACSEHAAYPSLKSVARMVHQVQHAMTTTACSPLPSGLPSTWHLRQERHEPGSGRFFHEKGRQ